MRVEQRVLVLEDRADGLEARLRALENAGAAAEPRPAGTAFADADAGAGAGAGGSYWTESPWAGRSRPWAMPSLPRVELDDLLGGRVLAWVGGVAVLVGVALLLGIAVSRGWIDESARTLLAAAISLAVLGAGVRQKERGRGGDAAFAASAAGLAGCFACVIVAGAVYALVPLWVALAGAVATGALATVLAVRWRAAGIGALGILGALLSPVLVGAPPSGALMLMLVVVSGSATAVLLWQRWTWLGFAAFTIVTYQWGRYAIDTESVAAAVAVMTTFGLLTAAGAVGFDLRTRSGGVRAGSAVLLALNAVTLACVGALALWDWDTSLLDGWLVALAAVHLAGGLLALRSRRSSEALALTVLAIATLLGDLAFGALVSGLPLVLGWAAGAVGAAALVRRAVPGSARAKLAEAGLGGHLALALGHALVDEAPAHAAGGHGSATALCALAAVAAACMASSRLVAGGDLRRRAVLEGLGMVVLAYLTASMLGGLALALAWAGEAVALALVARPWRARDVAEPDPIALAGAIGFLGLAGALTVARLAPPAAIVDGLGHPLQAALALAAVAAGGLAVARALPAAPRAPLYAGVAVLVLFGVSIELVTPFQPGAGGGLGVPDLGLRQQGQALLSAVWALAGVALLVAGLVRDHPALRRGALALLGLTVAKVFLYDLASLTSLYRVASFIALGLLLLAGAFAWQRVRPGPPRDLRTVPPALR